MRDRAIFMLAARWPDDVRGTKYDHPPWHYIDLPYVPPGQPDTIKGVDPPDPNIFIGYRTNADVLKDPNATAAEKAVALCWIMHLTGDIHQPLHATGMFTTDYPPPKGDQGATKVFIRVKDDSDPISLHKFWDDLILGSDNFQDCKNRSVEIRTEYPRDKLPELSQHVEPSDIQKWAQESFEDSQEDGLSRRRSARQPRSRKSAGAAERLHCDNQASGGASHGGCRLPLGGRAGDVDAAGGRSVRHSIGAGCGRTGGRRRKSLPARRRNRARRRYVNAARGIEIKLATSDRRLGPRRVLVAFQEVGPNSIADQQALSRQAHRAAIVVQ